MGADVKIERVRVRHAKDIALHGAQRQGRVVGDGRKEWRGRDGKAVSAGWGGASKRGGGEVKDARDATNAGAAVREAVSAALGVGRLQTKEVLGAIPGVGVDKVERDGWSGRVVGS